MANPKIIKISLETSYVGENKFEELETQIDSSSKAINKLSASLTGNQSVFKSYNTELQSTLTLLSSIQALKSGKSTTSEATKQKTKDTSIQTAKDTESELMEIQLGMARWQKSQRSNRVKAERLADSQIVASRKAASQSIIGISEASVKAGSLEGIDRQKAQLLLKEKVLREGIKKQVKDLHNELAKGAITAFKFNAQRAKAANSYRTELKEVRSELLALNKQEALGASLAKQKEKNLKEASKKQQSLLKQQRAAALSSQKTSISASIAQIKASIAAEVAEHKTGSYSIENIRRRSAEARLQLEKDLQKSIAKINNRLTGSSAAKARMAALKSFASQSRKIATNAENSITKLTNRRKYYESIKEKGLRTSAQAINSQQKLTSATSNTAHAADRLLRTNKSILRHTFEIVAGYRTVNFLLNQAREAAFNVPKQGVEEQANLAALTGAFGTTQATKELELASHLAEKYGSNLRALEVSMRKFAPSALLAGASLQEVNEIFDDFTAVGTVLHKTGDEMESIFLALEQMFAKGTVQSEEIKKQLGNQLPAAVEIGAEAMEMSVSKFLAAMKRNEIVAKEFVPVFAELYRTIFSGEGDAVLKSLSDKVLANYQRVLNRYTELNRAVFGQTESALNVGLKAVGTSIGFLTENLNALGLVFKSVFLVGGLRVVAALISSTKHMFLNAVQAERTANVVIASNLKMMASYRALSKVETATLAKATASRSALALASSNLLGRGGVLIATITGVSAATLGYLSIIPALGAGMAYLAGVTIDYTVANETLVGGSKKVTKALSDLSLSYVNNAKVIIESIREINSQEKSPERNKALGEQVGKLSALGKEYETLAEKAGISNSESKELVNTLTDLAGEYTSATSEAKNLSSVEFTKVEQSFAGQIVKIAETASALETLSNQYVESQKEADILAGKVHNAEHYEKLKEASTFALKELEKHKRASKDFFVSYKKQQVSLSAIALATAKISAKGFKDMASWVWRFGKAIGNVIVKVFDVVKSKVTEVASFIYDTVKSVTAGTAGIASFLQTLASTGGDIGKASEASGKAFQKTGAQIDGVTESVLGLNSAVGSGIAKGISGIVDGVVSPVLEEGLSKTLKADTEFLKGSIDSFLSAFKKELSNTDSDSLGAYKVPKKVIDETKALLVELKARYDQDLIDIEYYYTRKTELEEQFLNAKIASAKRELDAANSLITGVEGAAADVKAIELQTKLTNLENERGVIRSTNSAAREKDSIKFESLVDRERIKYLQLTGQLVKAEEARQGLRDTSKLKASAESGSASAELRALGEELTKIQAIQDGRTKQEAFMAELLQKTTNAQASLGNFRTVQAAEEKTHTTSYIEGMFARTEANKAFLVVQKQIQAEAELGYNKEADLNGDMQRKIEASRASLIAFQLESNEVSNAVQENLTNNLSTAFSDFITGAKSAGEAMKDFALSILDSMAQIAANQLATQIIGGLFSLGGSALSSDLTGVGTTATKQISGSATSGQLDILKAFQSRKGNVIPNGVTQFSKGGIPDIGNKEAAFPMGSLREGGKTEAILPVYRTSDGDLGVKTSGTSASTGIAIGEMNIVVQATNDSSEEQGAAISKAINAQLTSLMQEQIRLSKRPGAILNPTSVSSVF